MNGNSVTQPLAEFTIKALHGERNITIPFDGPVKIIVAENGYGKTTILNMLHALLFDNYSKLRATKFDSISLKFKSGVSVVLDKTDFSMNFQQVPQSGVFLHLNKLLGSDLLIEIFEDYRRLPRTEFGASLYLKPALEAVHRHFPGIAAEGLIQWLEMFSNELGNALLYGPKLLEARDTIRNEFPFEPIYLPTYRRIEEDLKNFTGIPISPEIDKSAIQFGMTDVQASFKRITTEIKDSSVQWFSKVSGQMLRQLIDGIKITPEMQTGLEDRDALKIVLARIGDNMPEGDKEKILRLIESKEILTRNDVSLAYFLANLVKVYEQQKVNDNAIKQFTEKSNRYFGDKVVQYDQSAVEISIKRKKNGHDVSVNLLSSGEKQIISLFSRLFLGKPKRFAIFFDEPELSLSIEWQRQLLPDIMDSGVCDFLFCTTHSPFIFDNDLTRYATGLDRYVEEL